MSRCLAIWFALLLSLCTAEARKIHTAGVGVNIKTLGAAGDGFTDDTRAFLSAQGLGPLPDGSWETVYVPRGTYLIRTNIVVHYRQRWVGEHSIILALPTFKGPGLFVTRSYYAQQRVPCKMPVWEHDFTIENFVLDGAGVAPFGVVVANAGEESLLSRVIAYRCKQAGFWLAGCHATLIMREVRAQNDPVHFLITGITNASGNPAYPVASGDIQVYGCSGDAPLECYWRANCNFALAIHGGKTELDVYGATNYLEIVTNTLCGIPCQPYPAPRIHMAAVNASMKRGNLVYWGPGIVRGDAWPRLTAINCRQPTYWVYDDPSDGDSSRTLASGPGVETVVTTGKAVSK